MWIVAGPNGAGKTTFVGSYLENLRAAFPGQFGGLTKLNADDRTAELRRKNPDADQHTLNLQAAQNIDAIVDGLIEAGKASSSRLCYRPPNTGTASSRPAPRAIKSG